MRRRTFLHTSGLTLLGSVLAPRQACRSAALRLREKGVQLYTVRERMATQPADTLRRLAEIGYTQVEGANYQSGKIFGVTPADFRQLLDNNGLQMPSIHTLTGRYQEDATTTMVRGWERALADFRTMGQQYVALAWLFPEERATLDDYRSVAELLNRCGELSQEYGIRMAYHNHDFEFVAIDGQLPYDLLLQETDPQLVAMELDLYWITKAGYTPADYFRKAPGRFPLWHVKDMAAGEEGFFTEVGNGIIDWPSLFRQRQLAGLEHFFVEQDICRNHPPLESLAISYAYLDAH